MESTGRFRERFAKAKVCQGLFFSLLFSPLFFYLVLERPEVPNAVVIVLHSFWIISLLMDMRSILSIKNKIKRHEANFLFRVLYTKFNPAIAVVIQILIEFSFVMLFPIISTIRESGQYFEMDWMSSVILGAIVGVLHIFAWYQNKKTIMQLTEDDNQNIVDQ